MATSRSLIPAPTGAGSAADFQEVRWAFPELRPVRIGGRMFIGRIVGSNIDLEAIKAILEDLGRRTMGQRVAEFLRDEAVMMAEAKRRLRLSEPLRIARQKSYRELYLSSHHNQPEGDMSSSEEQEYRQFLSDYIETASSEEVKRSLQLELSQLDFGWKRRTTCGSCGGNISLKRLMSAIRTTMCTDCARGTMPYTDTSSIARIKRSVFSV